jgi:hypothetical protein
MIGKKDNRGGKRITSGRKKSNIETRVISFRVPLEKARTLKIKINNLIKNKNE